MLRTKIVPGAEAVAHHSLWILVAGVLTSITGAVLGWAPLAAGGLLAYLGALGWLAYPAIITLRNKPPVHFASWSLVAGLGWFIVLTAVMALELINDGDWTRIYQAATDLTPQLAAGFAAQVLLGALS